MILRAKSPAKVNLFLHVIGKRDDGYHLLQSLFAPLNDLYDEISASPSSDISVNYGKSRIENDIIAKTANLLQKQFNITAGASFQVKKNIPISAGLGGGSSNAATAILLLNELWDLQLSTQTMLDAAVQIGADVPFFINPKTSFIEGIGEIIKPFPLNKKFHILLVNPNTACSTIEIFKMGLPDFDAEIITPDIINSHNSLTHNACIKNPEIKDVLNFLAAQENIVISRMSGSGATCFALFENHTDLKNAQEKTPKEWWSHSQELIL